MRNPTVRFDPNRCSTALVAMLFCSALPAAHVTHTPARLLEGEHSIEARLRVPKNLKTGLHKVYCEAQISIAGLANDFTCYALEDSAPKNLITAVARAGKRAHFAPATRNGVPADVYMLVMVRVYVPGDGEPLVLAVPNNGVEEHRYGLFYTAPQRFNEFTWGAHLPEEMLPRHAVMWQKLEVDEHGKVTEVDITGLVGSSAAIIRTIEAQVRRMEFMPGFADGKPVPMSYREPAFTIRGW
jgi:hypothetical protein